MWSRTPARSFTRPPRISTTECSCRLWPSPPMYEITSKPFVSRTLATLRSAELGFFGVVVYTLVHTPRRCGQPFSAGLLLFTRASSRGLRTSWLIVGMFRFPLFPCRRYPACVRISDLRGPFAKPFILAERPYTGQCAQAAHACSAVDRRHHCLGIAVARGRAGRKRHVQARQLLRIQRDLGGRRVLLQITHLLGSGNRNDVVALDRKSTRLNSSHLVISYAVFCLKKKKK